VSAAETYGGSILHIWTKVLERILQRMSTKQTTGIARRVARTVVVVVVVVVVVTRWYVAFQPKSIGPAGFPGTQRNRNGRRTTDTSESCRATLSLGYYCTLQLISRSTSYSPLLQNGSGVNPVEPPPPE
jgi:hypothetical protein